MKKSMFRIPRTQAAKTAVAAVLAAALPVLAACGAGGSGADEGNTLRIAMSAANIPFPSTPPSEGYEGHRFVGQNIYDGLTRLNLNQSEELPTPHPSLAESWDMSEDMQTYTFHLRDDVTFHDGTEFDANAAAFGLSRILDPDFEFFSQLDSSLASYYTGFIDTWQALDDYTLEITTTQPYAWLDWDLTHIFFPSPAVVQEYGNEDYNQHASGTGPFRMTQYVDGEVMELTRNDDYWRGPAKLDKIVLYPQPEPASRLSMLQSGEVNWAEVPAPDALEQLESEGFVIYLEKYPHGIVPMFNMFREPFADNLELRQALNYALDRDGLAELINNVGYGASQYVYPEHPHAADNPGYSYDPERAAELLAEAGYEPGDLTITMAYPTGGSGNMFPEVMMQKLQADYAAIGVDTVLEPMEWTTLISAEIDGLDKPQWEHIDILWSSPAPGASPSLYANNFMCERGDQPSAAGLCDREMEELYLEASRQPDRESQNAYLQQMMDMAIDNAYFLFWMHDLNLRVLAPEVKGYIQPQSWMVDFTTVYVED